MTDIKTITIKSSEYPQILKEISDPPELLYWRGDLKALKYKTALAIVGTRRCSQYGREATKKITRPLANAGVTIISGMARGIDTAAHETALEAGATTIAILGSGIDDKSIYPQQNLKLAHKILESGGLIMSEYKSGTPGLPHQFPKRNRIVAGLSQGTLVIEAPLKSGSRITARLALEYNRDVFVVPGSIFSRLNEGSHWLLQQGAICATDAKDILEHLSVADTDGDKRKFQPGASPPLAEKIHMGLSRKEQAVLELISEASDPIHIDKIIQDTKLSTIEVSQILTSLMIKNIIKEAEANTYIATN